MPDRVPVLREGPEELPIRRDRNDFAVQQTRSLRPVEASEDGDLLFASVDQCELRVHRKTLGVELAFEADAGVPESFLCGVRDAARGGAGEDLDLGTTSCERRQDPDRGRAGEM